MADQETRPRFGTLTRRDGTTVPLVFHPTTEPAVFVGRHADDEQPVILGLGDTLQVDVIGPGQSVVLEMPSQPAPDGGYLTRWQSVRRYDAFGFPIPLDDEVPE